MAADIDVRIQRDAAHYRLFVDGAEIVSAGSPDALLRQLIDCLDAALVQRLNGLHAVHAGAVLLGGKALLMPGASHSGKSSLVAELLRHGAVCLSDEYALIDADGRVHAYPRILLVRRENGSQMPVLPEQYDSAVAETPAEVGWILSLQFHDGGTWEVTRVAQSMALLSLLQNTPHVLTGRPQMVEPFQRAVNQAHCYAGKRGEAADAVRHILKLTADEP